jgi:hypothetical protein
MAIREMDKILEGTGPSKDAISGSAASALAEANRQVQEQKRLLQQEQMKLLKVLNGSGGDSQAGSLAAQALPSAGNGQKSHRRDSSESGQDPSFDDRMLQFLKDENIKSPRTPRVITPRQRGRVVNLPAHPKSKETQFVI